MILIYVRFEFFMAVAMKNAVFWDVTVCGGKFLGNVGSYKSHMV
jgi:preprotein translocase subunit SecF